MHYLAFRHNCAHRPQVVAPLPAAGGLRTWSDSLARHQAASAEGGQSLAQLDQVGFESGRCLVRLMHTYQSDVETVHRLEEDDFFDLEDSSSRGDFLAKAHTYQIYFDLVPPDSHKDNQSPWQIIAPRSPLELCLLRPVFLDYHLNDSGGYDVPRQPSFSTSH